VGQLWLGNDNALWLIGLQSATDESFVLDATVTGQLRQGDPAGSIVASSSISLSIVSNGSDSVGGTPTSPTIVKSVSAFAVTVTVGATNALALAAGRFLRFAGKDEVWRLELAAAGAAGTAVKLYLEHGAWSGELPSDSVEVELGDALVLLAGNYKGILPSTLVLTDGETYYSEVTAVSPSVGTARFLERLRARYRVAA